MPEYKSKFVEAVSASGLEWGVYMGDCSPVLDGVPQEITDGIAEAYAKITKQIRQEEILLGVKLVRHAPAIELVGEDPTAPVPTPGVYFQITVRVSLRD